VEQVGFCLLRPYNIIYLKYKSETLSDDQMPALTVTTCQSQSNDLPLAQFELSEIGDAARS
jgi:hypothetical protein